MAQTQKAVSFKATGIMIGATGTTYADNDAIGTITLIPNVCGAVTGFFGLQSVVVQDLSNQKSKLELIFFDSAPTSTFTDDGAFTLTDADIKAIVGTVIINAGDYQSYAANAVATVGNLGLEMQSTSGADLWMAVISRGTPTYVANELSFTIAGFKDEA